MDFVMPSGRHKGVKIARVPVSYLFWMVNAQHTFASIAEKELMRRGSVLPEMSLSYHAIDRASLRLLSLWKKRRGRNEGLAAWLQREALAAIQHGRKHGQDPNRIYHVGIEFRFDLSGRFPELLTVMKQKTLKKAPSR